MPFPTIPVTPGAGQVINTLPNAGQATSANSLSVVVASDQSTLPISAAALPLPSGAAQDGTDGTGITAPTGAVGIRGWLSGIYSKLTGSIAVTGTFWQATQPISAASLPLPSGAAQDGTDGTGIAA